ncbi:MAG: monofunctional biosynthetic peptidoglycan transglycosylase [Desulfobulbaceae bacterium]|nr:monofunctional biosynthetic peptidoglycan transglycosylase [Desulfobulbaceae bacterium]
MSKTTNRKATSRFLALLKRALLLLVLLPLVMPPLLILGLRWLHPPTSAFMLHYRIESLFTTGKKLPPLRQKWVDWAAISPALPLAAVAAEDQKFPGHWGFDLESISEAMAKNAKGHRIHGASTISQQVAKNLFLWSGRSYLRKGLEAYLTLLLEVLWPKQRILEVYVNIAEFGEGIYGARAAAEAFFHKSPALLSQGEAALMAAVLPNPKQLRVDRPSAYVRERQEWILTQMGQLGAGYITNMGRAK